jgi:hypothetical protein
MKNSDIIKLLHENDELRNVKFPAGIYLTVIGKLLTVKLEDVCGNMQTDKVAFEGWIICLYSWMSGRIKKVELEWAQTKDVSNKHYNRFLFRVLQFKKMYKWFSVSKINSVDVQSFMKKISNPDLKINYPKAIKRSSISARKREDYIESLFVNKYSNLVRDKFELSTFNQQLPVGVFDRFVKGNAYFFSGQKSAIDLWGVNGEELSIFELKFKNKKVGIISELLFYLGLMQAVFMTQEIQYPKEALDINFRDFEKLYSKKFKKLTGYFLIDELHPLIVDDVIILINKGLKNLGNISIQKQCYIFDPDNDSLKWR